MVDITDQENFRPKVFLQGVLGFDRGQIVASRDDAIVEDEEIVLTLIKHYVLATSADAVPGEGNKKINCHMAGEASFHESGDETAAFEGRLVLTYRNYSKTASIREGKCEARALDLCKPLIPKLKRSYREVVS